MRNNWRSILFDVAKRQLFRLCLVSSISGLVRGVLSSDEIFACCILLHPVASCCPVLSVCFVRSVRTKSATVVTSANLLWPTAQVYLHFFLRMSTIYFRDWRVHDFQHKRSDITPRRHPSHPSDSFLPWTTKSGAKRQCRRCQSTHQSDACTVSDLLRLFEVRYSTRYKTYIYIYTVYIYTVCTCMIMYVLFIVLFALADLSKCHLGNSV